MSMYNESKHVLAPERDYDAIKNKWKALKNIKKPTGDPTCPPLVVRAKMWFYPIAIPRFP
jgi:hypothetical protein